MAPWEWFALLLSLYSGFRSPSRPKSLVMLHILDNEDETPRCARILCDGVANLGEFRAVLEKKPSRIPWPFDFYDSKQRYRIAAEWEHSSPLELYDHEVTVIRSHGRQAMVENESMALTEPTTAEVASDAGSVNSTDDKQDVIPLVSSVSMAPVACDLISTPHYEEQDLHEETCCPELEPKHKVFLSHSGVQKGFVKKLCKLLEAHNHFPFFDQRSDSLPEGKKFAGLIIEAAKTCQVAVVVLSEDYLSSKWPMIELAEFVRASKSENKNLNLLPLFYQASVSDLDDKKIKEKWMPKWKALVGGDPRVDLEKWAEAVRELRRVNGLEFHKFENKESYRDAIVIDIFRLAPPDCLYDTSKVLGRKRICEFLADKFQPDPKTSASVLGLYGMGGLGKSTISKCLYNHFNQEFLGRVCYIEMREEVNALERQRKVMRKLLRLDELMMQDIDEASKGWNILKIRMKENPVFLVIDNVQPDDVSRKETLEYLNVEYSSQSKIMIVSRSLEDVKSLLGDRAYCCEIPRLGREEAAGILLQEGAPKLEYSSLSKKEREIVEGCLGEAWFPYQEIKQANTFLYPKRNEGGHYHPLALEALGAYFHEKSTPSDVLSWNRYLDEYKVLKGTGGSYDTLFKILGLQFITWDQMTQLMFLDIVLYALDALKKPMLSNSPLKDMIAWLANVHEQKAEVVKRKISYFRRCAMLNIEGEKIIVHDLYKEYAIWALKHVINSREFTGVFHVRFNIFYVGFNIEDHDDSSLPHELQSSPSGTCWQALRSIRLENISCHGFAMTKIREWQNIVVLQISRCNRVTTLNLQGLTCIRHLELKRLRNLETLILTGDGSTSPENVSQATYAKPKHSLPQPRLQFVVFEWLSSLKCLPSFSPFTSLKFLAVEGCKGLTQPPMIQYCYGLERMQLEWSSKQETLPSLEGLMSLRDLTIHSGHIEPRLDEGLKLEGLSSLISLEALELQSIPVGDLNGLENLTNIEFILLRDLYLLADLPPLESLASSSLHVLEVSRCRLEGLVKLEQLIKQKLEKLAAQGETVSHIPSKIRNSLPRFEPPYAIYAKDSKDVPDWMKATHDWENDVRVDDLKKSQLKVKMCCFKCEEKVIEGIREVPGVFDVRAERRASKVVVVAKPGVFNEHAVLKKARKVDKKAKFVELDVK